MFFPIWGGIVAVCALALVWPAYALGVTWPVLAIVALGVSIILSGALHEDGLADCCDGFFGGRTPEDRHRIMKDSTIGSYGTLGLIFSIALRWLGLMQFDMFLFVLIHIVPRGFMGILWATFPLWQGKGLATQSPSLLQGSISLLLTIALVLFSIPLSGAIIVLVATGLSMLAFCFLARHKLGGLNGDCFGGAEQCGQMALCIVFPQLAYAPYLLWA